MRIPYLRLVDDEDARDATLEVVRQAASSGYDLRGFEWPLMRRVMEARYNRMGDVGFIFGFTTVACMRWALHGPPVARRALMVPVYSGFVIREFATADTARRSNYADFLALTGGIDSPLGEMARAEMKKRGQDPEHPFPKLMQGPLDKGFGSQSVRDLSSWKRNLALVFPALSRFDIPAGDAQSAAVLGAVAFASRFLLLHSICDVFGGTSIYERYEDGSRTDPPPLRETSEAMRRAKRFERITSMAKWDTLDKKLAGSRPGNAAKKNKKATMHATDLFALRISTRFYDWTPIEVMRCDRGADSSHIFSVSLPTPPADRIADVLRTRNLQRWFLDGTQPPLAAWWWAAFLPLPQ
jgi:hypothetical protein